MDPVTEKLQERAEVVTEAEELLEKAKNEERDLTNKEESKYNNLRSKAENLNREIRELKLEHEKNKKAIERELDGKTKGESGMNLGKRFYTKDNINEYRKEVKSRTNLPSGIKAKDLSAGRAIRSLITGDWSNAKKEQRVMSTTPDSSGGYVVPSSIAADIISKAFNQTSVLNAGASVFNMDSKNVTIPKISGVPEASFKSEGAEFTFGELTFSGVELESKSLWAGVSLTLELSEDGQDIEQAIENSLAEAIATKMDWTALNADGTSNDPTGIAHNTDVQTLESTTNALTELGNYDLFSEAVQKVRNENGDPKGLLYSPNVWGNLDRLKDSSNQPLQAPDSYNDLNKYVTKQVADNEAFIGDFSQLLWGVRSNLKIEVSQEAKDAFEKGLVYIRARLRGSIAIARPKWFVHITENLA